MPVDLGLEVYPLTRERWNDLVVLFGEHGACGGCWCMLWRLKRSQFLSQRGRQNKEALKSLVGSGHVPGILGYSGGKPVVWCAVSPHETLPALERSRILKRIDNQLVWSVVCFFVAKSLRHKDITANMLEDVKEYVSSTEEKSSKDTQWNQEMARHLTFLQTQDLLLHPESWIRRSYTPIGHEISNAIRDSKMMIPLSFRKSLSASRFSFCMERLLSRFWKRCAFYIFLQISLGCSNVF